MAERDFKEVKNLVEAALFLAGKWIGVGDLCRYAGVNENKVQKAIVEIRADYGKRNGPIDLSEQDGKFKLDVKPQYLDIVKGLAPQMDMRKAVLMTLSYIAFKQPITQSKMVKLFGNRIYEYNSELEKRTLINRVRHKRTRMLTTTKKLEEYLGAGDLEHIRKTKADIIEQRLKAEIAKEDTADQKNKVDEATQLQQKKELSLEEWEKLLEHRRVAEQKRLERKEKRKKAREDAAKQGAGSA